MQWPSVDLTFRDIDKYGKISIDSIFGIGKINGIRISRNSRRIIIQTIEKPQVRWTLPTKSWRRLAIAWDLILHEGGHFLFIGKCKNSINSQSYINSINVKDNIYTWHSCVLACYGNCNWSSLSISVVIK